MLCLQLAQGQGTSFSGCAWVKVFEFQTIQAGEFAEKLRPHIR